MERTKKNFEQGILELYIAIAYYSKNNHDDWLQSNNFFQSCLENLEKADRQDLVTENISLLCRVLRKLEKWDELYNIASKSKELHQKDGTELQLVEDYGFLAEAELKTLKLDQAKEYAETALKNLGKIPELRPALRCSHPRFTLAKFQEKHNKVWEAIDSLEKARKEINCQHDPYGYSEILNTLKQLYFDKKEYLKSVKIKQELIKFEQQYGLRAFIGVGYLQPSLSPARDKSKLTEDIPARQKDVENIINRLNRPECKLLVIHGFSGVGKSSLLQAGLIPALKNDSIDSTPVFPILIRHYTDWFEKIKENLINNIHEEIDSADSIIEKLKYKDNRINILIFDQFEEFFFVEKDEERRKDFYQFLCKSINLTNTKIIFSLREDYLYDLLEIERIGRSRGFQSPVDAFTNILDREHRYELSDLSKEEAKEAVQILNNKSSLQLDTNFLKKILNDLAQDAGKVRPIELQIIGYELQEGRINSENYSNAFHQREKIVQEYLYHEVIKDCGEANKFVAIYILYFLTGNNDTRPLKSKFELETDLQKTNISIQEKQIDLVLRILVTSRIVWEISEQHMTRYQLVHDYLVSPISQLKQLKELKELESERLKIEHQEKERQRLVKKQRNITGVASILMGIMLVVISISWQNTQKAEIKAISKTSEALFASNQRFDALKEGIKSAIKLKQNFFIGEGEDIHGEVKKTLQQPIYWLVERNRLDEHKGLVWSIAFSPDGKKIASASFDKTIRVWCHDGKVLNKLENNETSYTKNQHRDKVLSVTFSPNSQIIASGDFDGKIKLWKLNCDSKNFEYYKDIEDNKDNSLNKAHQKGVYSLAFSPDGRKLASASRDGSVKLWKVDIKNNIINTSLEKPLNNAHQDGVNSVAFSPNGNILATGGRDNTVKLWKQDSKGEFGNSTQTLPEKFKDFVWSLAWSPDGEKIAIASRDSTIKLWDWRKNLLFPFCSSSDCEKEPKSHNDRVMSVSFSADGKAIASGSLDNTVKLWKLDRDDRDDRNLKPRLITTLEGHSNGVYSVSFSPDCKTLVSAGADITIRLWQLDATESDSSDSSSSCEASTIHRGQLGNGVITTLNSHTDIVKKVTFLIKDQEEIIATASHDNTVKLWKRDGTLIQTLKGHTKKVNSLTFSRNGKIIATASDDKTVKLWNLDRKRITNKKLDDFNNHLLDVSFSPDGEKLAIGSKDNTITIFNLDDKQPQKIESYGDKNKNGHKDWVRAVAWSPDGNIVASASDDNTIKLWELKKNKNNNEFEYKQTLEGHNSWVFDVKFSPDGEKIVSSSNDKMVILWKKDSKGNFSSDKKLKGHDDEVNGVAFSHDGTKIASASGDKTVIIWDANSGKLLRTISGHNEELHSVSFSRDSKHLVLGSADNTAILWDISSLNSLDSIDELLKRGCTWLGDYLENNPNAKNDSSNSRLENSNNKLKNDCNNILPN